MGYFFVIASGPSLSQSDVDACRGRGKIIVVNDCYRLAPWADYLYACDCDWWRIHINDVRATFQGELWTSNHATAPSPAQTACIEELGLNWLPGHSHPGLGRDCLHYGENSGYQGINLAYLFGAKRITLLGFDMAPAPDGRLHWFGDHPAGLNNGPSFSQVIGHFGQLAADLASEGVEVVNASRRTALRCFPRRIQFRWSPSQ